MKLVYLKNKHIDILKWDKCINNAYNGNIYGYSWFLNIVCQNWDALVYDNYRAVFPLPIKKKFGLPVLYHPLLSGQLGIFSSEKLDPRLIHLFLERIPYKFRKINIKLNKYINLSNCDYNLKNHKTYVIDLIRNTTGIYSEYKPSLRQKIDRALLSKMTVINSLKPQEVINFLYNEETLVNKALKLDNINHLRKILSCMVSNHLGNVFAVYSGVNNICALGLFLFSHNKISVPIIAINEEGKENHAIELLIHTVIFNNIEKNVTLAYEESYNKYFSEIFASFGAEEKNYKEISKFRTVWPFNKIIS